MVRRLIKEDEIADTLEVPDLVEQVRANRFVYQSAPKESIDGHLYLLRVVVDLDRIPPEVVTAYRTSKIDKYTRSA